MTEETENALHQRATEAKLIIENPLFKEAIRAVKADYYAQFTRTEPEDNAKREALYSEQRALDEILRKLESYIVKGKIEQYEQENKTRTQQQ